MVPVLVEKRSMSRPSALQHGDEQVRQRIVALAVEGKMFAVPEAAAGQEDGQVDVGVGVGAAHAACRRGPSSGPAACRPVRGRRAGGSRNSFRTPNCASSTARNSARVSGRLP